MNLDEGEDEPLQDCQINYTFQNELNKTVWSEFHCYQQTRMPKDV